MFYVTGTRSPGLQSDGSLIEKTGDSMCFWIDKIRKKEI